MYHAILGEDKVYALLFVHVFTGCASVSSIYGKGKVLAWGVWGVFPEMTVSYPVNEIDDNVIANLEWFVIILYDIGSIEESFADARIDMFTRKCSTFHSLQHMSTAYLESCAPGRTCLRTDLHSATRNEIS